MALLLEIDPVGLVRGEPRWPATLWLELHRPDGTKATATGHVRREHLLRRPPGKSEYVWTLCLDIPKSAVPPGTEIRELQS